MNLLSEHSTAARAETYCPCRSSDLDDLSLGANDFNLFDSNSCPTDLNAAAGRAAAVAEQ